MRSPESPIPSGRERLRRDIDEELQFDLDMRIAEHVSRGLSQADAERAAAQEFGDLDSARKYCLQQDELRMRAIKRATWFQEFGQDLRQALRRLRRAPGLAFIAITTIATGIGANSAMFSVVNAFLVRELPYVDADRVLRIYAFESTRPLASGQISAADFVDYRSRARSFSQLGAFASGGGIYTGDGNPEALPGARVSANMFVLLGAVPMIGRTFTPADSASDAASMVVLSHGVWQRLFAGDSSIVGKQVDISGRRRIVIGVMPASFFFPTMSEAEIFTLLDLTPALADVNRARKFHFLGMLGRVTNGVKTEAAQAELATISSALAAEHPESNTNMGARAVILREAITGSVKTSLLMVFFASTILLLVAAVNIAGLLLTRAVGRQHEFAVRASLGAGRSRLVRQLVTESAVLAVAGGAIGLLVAVWVTRAFLQVSGGLLPIDVHIRLDSTLLLWTLAATLACTLICGLVPALSATQNVHERLKEGTRGLTGGATRVRLRGALLTGQLALAVVLLTGAGLLVQSLAKIDALRLGYSTENVLQFRVTLPAVRYPESAAYDAFFATLFEQIRSIPGVEDVASSGNVPLQGGSSASLAIEGRVASDRLPEVGYATVSDDFFRVLQIPMQAGRTFDQRDHDKAPGVAIVSAAVAKQFWGDADPVGARIRLGPNPSEPWSTVVGVVGDVRSGPAGGISPTVYVSSRQDHWSSNAIIVKSSGDPASLIPSIRTVMKRSDPGLAVVSPQSMSESRAAMLADRRVPMQIMTAFGVLALGLAGLGIFGTMAYSVASRTREIGLRVALGAAPREVMVLVLRQGFLVWFVGAAIGTAGSVALGHAIASILFETAPTDMSTIITVSGILLVVTIVACFIPARRAARVDPMVAMRAE